MTWTEKAQPIKEKLDAIEAAGGIVTSHGQSDKLGSDWVSYYVNDILVKRDYVEQENPQGTADNPIAYTANVPLIPNAYYILDGVRKVWMGQAAEHGDWTDNDFVEF